MVRLVRLGKSMRWVASRLKVDPSTVSRWVQRTEGQRLDRTDFAGRKPGRAWNRTEAELEQRIVELRHSLGATVLGECGARAIHHALRTQPVSALPSIPTINRVLSRRGLQDGTRRIRRAAPPKGWYLPAVMAGSVELDSFDFIEELKIADGPLIHVLTAKSLHGALTDAWVLDRPSATASVSCLLGRWQHAGLPGYAQFDNDTVFQGAHQFPDTVGRVSRLCLALGVIPVFAPPAEHGMQNGIESFNALWQAKVWHRYHFSSVAELKARSHAYIAAHRARTAEIAAAAPPRRVLPVHFEFDLRAPLRGQIIFIRRTDDAGRVHLLGQRFAMSAQWPNRLVRCEVDFDHRCIRGYALRRRNPAEQPLLATLEYHRSYKPFRGEP
jgi:hypothetical protein